MLLEEVIGPAIVRLVLNVDLLVAKVGFRPLISNDRAEAFSRAIVRPIDDAVIVETMISARFHNRDNLKSLAVNFGRPT